MRLAQRDRGKRTVGHRLSKIVTRTGDSGTTGLATGERVPKWDDRIEAIGEIDELNSQLGVLLTHELPAVVRDFLQAQQHRLFDLGGELSMPGVTVLREEDIERVEAALEALNDELQPLKEFILPGGSAAAASCHLVRAVARRAERRLWALNAEAPLNTFALRYLNRLSDYLFVAARTLARAEGVQEVSWCQR